jgi:hypothetical protein
LCDFCEDAFRLTKENNEFLEHTVNDHQVELADTDSRFWIFVCRLDWNDRYLHGNPLIIRGQSRLKISKLRRYLERGLLAKQKSFIHRAKSTVGTERTVVIGIPTSYQMTTARIALANHKRQN